MRKSILHAILISFVTSAAFALSLGDNTVTPSTPLCSDRIAIGRVGDTTAKRSTVCGLEAHGADIASSSTINLTNSTGQLVDVTGTTTITAITLAEGQERTVRFTGALTLTHSSNLVLPGAANITTAAGDFAIFRGYGSSIVRMVHYQKAAGAPVSGASKLSAFASTSSAELAGVISNETGSGLLTFATSPTLTTPVLGVASATSINKVALTAPASGSTLTIADGKTLTASNTLTLTGTDSSSVAFGAGGTVAYTGDKLSVFAATTSAELLGVISDETGTGALVAANSPTLVTPAIGSATATTQSAGDNSTKVATTAYVDTLGATKQPLDADLTAIAGVTSAADKVPYFTGSGTAAVADFTAAGRALIDDTDAAAQRTTLGLTIGTNVQAYDAELAALAGLTSAADKGIQFTGSGTAATYDLTTAGKALLDDADAAAQRTTLGLGTTLPVYKLCQSFSAVANSGTGETDLHTCAVAGGTLITTGQSIEYAFRGIFLSSANAKTFKVYFGSTVVINNSFPINTAGSYYGKMTVTRTGSSAQSISYELTRTATGGGTAMTTNTTTATEAEGSTITIKTTGQGGASTELNTTYSMGLNIP